LIKVFLKNGTHLWNEAIVWEREHPYAVSFFLSLIIISYMLFYTPSLEFSKEDFSPVENIQFLDIETIQSPKRVVKKEVTTDEVDVSEETTNVERAVGTSDEESAVDVSFVTNFIPPKPVGRLKKIYPKSGKEHNVEAIINVELLIAANGKVKNVNILGIKLTKALHPELYRQIARDFTRDARKILLGAQFTPPIVEGRQVPIRMEMPLRFRLD